MATHFNSSRVEDVLKFDNIWDGRRPLESQRGLNGAEHDWGQLVRYSCGPDWHRTAGLQPHQWTVDLHALQRNDVNVSHVFAVDNLATRGLGVSDGHTTDRHISNLLSLHDATTVHLERKQIFLLDQIRAY